MVPAKPLKVFLSYSHRDVHDRIDQDQRTRFEEFRKQLNGLVYDGVIEIWWDREITAGTAWNTEIEKALNECDVFLPLLSASFIDSSYIRETELPAALRRHRAGQCRIMPVLWKAWTPTEQSGLKSCQFLNALENPVCSARAHELDDLLCRIVEELRRAIAKGRNMVADPSAGKPPAPPPADLPYLCDWTRPIAKLASLAPATGAEPRPSVLVLAGVNEDRADRFLDRVWKSDLPKALGMSGRPVRGPFRADWPDSGAEFLTEIRPHFGEPGLVYLQLTAGGWDEDRARVLDEMLDGFRRPEWKPPPQTGLVTVISVMPRRRDTDLARRIQSVLDRTPDVPSALIVLPEIKLDDALGWVARDEVRARCRPDSEMALRQEISNFFEQRNDAPVPMGILAPELNNILAKYLERGAA